MSDDLRVRIKTGWSAFDGCEGELVDTFPADGDVLVHLDGEERPLRFGEEAVEMIDDRESPQQI